MSDSQKACGIDFGSSEIVVAVVDSTDPLGTKLVPNMLSNETTPGVLKVYREVRIIGEDAAATATMCPQNVYHHLPLVLKYVDCIDKLKALYPDMCFNMKADPERGVVFDVMDDSLLSEVSILHAVTMLFNYVFKIVVNKYPDYVNKAVIAVPSGFGPNCIRIVSDAARLAGFQEIIITNTEKSQSYNYCFKNKHSGNLSADKDRHVLFVDQGSCFTDMYVVRMNSSQCEIIHSESRQFGAKDIDRLLYNYFTEEIVTKRGCTIRRGSKQAIRLANGCKKLKEMLSSSTRAWNTVDGLIDGDEYQLNLTRGQMETIVNDQMRAFEEMAKALRTAYTGVIDAVEMIGGGCRIDFMKRTVESVFGLPLSFTVDSASCIAKGAALMGIYDQVKEQMTLVNDWQLAGEENHGEEYEKTRELEEKIRARDAEQQRRAEAKNKLESLIDSMRRELSGPFASKLNATTLNSLLDAESDWLFMEGETSTTEEMEKRWDTLQNRLKEEYKEYYEAKEAHRLEVEKQLEEESKKHEKDTKEDVKLPYSQRMARVEANKKEGTDLFKDKNYTNAARFYKQALIHCSKFFNLSPEQKQAVADMEKSLHLNLAQCFIKLETWDKSIEHSTTVLKTDPKNTKALYRRAFCYDKLKDVEKCSQDLKIVLELSPEDPSVKNLAARNEAERKRQAQRRKEMAKRMFGGN